MTNADLVSLEKSLGSVEQWEPNKREEETAPSIYPAGGEEEDRWIGQFGTHGAAMLTQIRSQA